jgi:hypothetical protein
MENSDSLDIKVTKRLMICGKLWVKIRKKPIKFAKYFKVSYHRPGPGNHMVPIPTPKGLYSKGVHEIS